MKNPITIIRHLFQECLGGWLSAEGAASKFRLAGDFALLRFYRLTKQAPSNCPRRVRVQGGVWLNYRLNEGDLQGIREVWLDGCYRLPSRVHPETLVDLGGNLGLTSLWYAKRYPIKNLIIVEPDPDNAALIRRNMTDNGVNATVIEAAVGPQDGTVTFITHERSNVGHVVSADGGDEKSVNGVRLPMVSMPTVLAKLPAGVAVDLLKMDIEGGETALIGGDLAWLERVRFIIAELHPPMVDVDAIVTAIEAKGLRHHVPGSLFRESMTMFERQ